ncbi:hypothetical protein ACCT04_36620, partial [Rhizobium ruizarguesonis]
MVNRLKPFGFRILGYGPAILSYSHGRGHHATRVAGAATGSSRAHDRRLTPCRNRDCWRTGCP